MSQWLIDGGVKSIRGDRVWVEIDVHLRRTSDCVERVYRTVEPLEDDGASLCTCHWEEGNFSCDCNRALFFARAAGEDDPDDTPCGEHRFVARLVNPATGEVVYDERLSWVKHRTTGNLQKLPHLR